MSAKSITDRTPLPRPTRVLLTLDALDISGVAFSAQNLATGLQREGVSVTVLARAGGEREGTMAATGAVVHVFRFLGVPFLGHGALQAAESFKPEIVHAQSTPVVARSWRMARDLGVPCFVTVNRLDRKEARYLAKHEEIGVIALSEAIQERLINKAGIKRDRIAVIPNGLDLAHFPDPAYRHPFEPGRRAIIGTYGTLIEQKGQRTFLQAAARLVAQGVDAEFLIMGHGPDKPGLRRLCEELGIHKRVTFSPSTISDVGHIANIDIFVEPTHQEGFGLSVLQAMAAGVPVVASGVGGIFSIVKDGQTGLLVKRGDVEAMAAAILGLLQDSRKRQEMALHAREEIEQRYSAEKVARKLLAAYGRLLAGRPAAAPPEREGRKSERVR